MADTIPKRIPLVKGNAMASVGQISHGQRRKMIPEVMRPTRSRMDFGGAKASTKAAATTTPTSAADRLKASDPMTLRFVNGKTMRKPIDLPRIDLAGERAY